MKNLLPTIASLHSKYTKDAATGCWNYSLSLNDSGYGLLKTKEGGVWKTKNAHRVFYERLVGPIPTGLQIDHLCKNRKCVNPSHLEPVTAQENVRRARYSAVCENGHRYTDQEMSSRGKSSKCGECKRLSSQRYHKQFYKGRHTFVRGAQSDIRELDF